MPDNHKYGEFSRRPIVMVMGRVRADLARNLFLLRSSCSSSFDRVYIAQVMLWAFSVALLVVQTRIHIAYDHKCSMHWC